MDHLEIKLSFLRVFPKEPGGRERGWGAIDEVPPAPRGRAGAAPRGGKCLRAATTPLGATFSCSCKAPTPAPSSGMREDEGGREGV